MQKYVVLCSLDNDRTIGFNGFVDSERLFIIHYFSGLTMGSSLVLYVRIISKLVTN